MPARLAIAAVLAFFLAAQASLAAEVTMESLLNEMTDYSAVARWPLPTFTCRQCSSYDRSEVSPDQPGWFGNNDFSQYIRTEENGGRKEQVMMDADGPGCIVRFWLTTTKNKKGSLRVYLDGNSIPTLTFPAYDLLSGDLNLGAPLDQPHPGYSPVDNGGNTLMLPIPYAKHCKVTWEEAGEGPRYYQIDYRTYAPGTAVQTFTRETLATSRHLIEQVGKNLLSPPQPPPGRPLSLNKTIQAGKSVSLHLPAGPAAVIQVELRNEGGNAAELERTLRSTIIQLRFDNEDAVWCPAGDFFGSGVGANQLQSWYRTVQPDGTMSCRWAMPYAKNARVTLANVGKHPVKVTMNATVGDWHWDDRSMHFHATWHYEAGLTTPPARDWNYIRIAGRGVYVGDTLALFNPVATWYGEGDEKIRVDGELLPSFLGTGTEDYYDFSFAPRGLMQTPFANQVRVDQPMTQGNNALTRTRNLDGIPFSKSLNFDFELISWRPAKLIYAATTYWYAFPGASSNIRPQPREASLPVPTLAKAVAASAPQHRPGAVECENLKVLARSGDFPVAGQNMESFGAERWSGGSQLLIKPTAIGDFVDIQVPAPDDKPCRLMLFATQASDYGILQFSVNGQAVLSTFDGYATEVRPAVGLNLGVFTPHDRMFTLRIQVMGANAAATGPKYLCGLDCIVLGKL